MQRLVKYLLSAVFIGHFAILFLYNLPENPLSTQYDGFLQRYTAPWFTQNWSMFAPPARSNLDISLQFITYKQGQADTSVFYEVLSPLYKGNKVTNNKALGRISYYLFNSVYQVYKANNFVYDEVMSIDTLKYDTAKFTKYFYDKIERLADYKEIQHYAEKSFQRMQASEFGVGLDSAKLGFKLVNIAMPDFKDRFDEEAQMANQDVYIWYSRFHRIPPEIVR